MIQAENLQMRFNDREVFRGLNLTINDGEVVGIIGSSGSGKSMLLRCLVMLQKPTGGKIYLDGTDITGNNADITEARKKIGIIFQNFNLFQHMSVVENVMSGQVHLQGVSKEDAFAESMRLLKMVGLMDKAYAYPSRISGGQQQRAAIARTLAMKPQIILLDEPTSALDPLMRGEVESVIRMMASEGHTMVIATHEMELVRQICNRVLFLDEGVIYEEGTPEKIFDNPERTRTRRFVRALKVLEFDVESKDFDFIGASTTISDYTYRNGISFVLQERLQSIMEELFQMIIIQPRENNKMHASFEYNRSDASISGIVRFSGPPMDSDDPLYFFSWPIIKMRASKVEIREVTAGDYTNEIRILLR